MWGGRFVGDAASTSRIKVARPRRGLAHPGSTPAGMYTADLNGVRASWVVRADGSATGVQNSGSNDSNVADVVIENEQKFRDQVRNRSKLQAAAQLVDLQNRSARSTINGVPVVAVLVNGNFRLG